MSETINKFVKEKVAELRLRLLDLSNRNALLNFRHSEKALTHIRIIDELPDFLFGEFLNGQRLTFKPLPPLDNEPHDEQSEEFRITFRESTLTDEQYLEEVASLEDDDDSFDQMAVIERSLKNRVRERLGMPPVHDLKPLSNAQWARQNDLEPKYDMPLPSSDDYEPSEGKHVDEYIQTLLKPDELRHKLSGLRRYINSDISERGVNTFYAAFGFLERYDSEGSDKPYFAPLVLLQMDTPELTKKADGEIFVSIQATGEAPQYNLPLAEKLKEFGLSLPEFDVSDSPESYMSKIERLIKNKKGWRVRRFVTFGRFQFARLVMYHDLDPKRWPKGNTIDKNGTIKSLLAGENDNGEEVVPDEPDIYEIDNDADVARLAPFLIMDADSSQHSAIVDAMKGKNLVIKGPPGTGKSQTITNLIANAISSGKSVLFIAEKMAALNVVYNRLQSAGLGNYCLELHSTKAKLKDIKEGLAATIENNKTASPPKDLKKHIEEIKQNQIILRNYSDLIHQPIGNSDKTIHDTFWGEQIRRNKVSALPVSVKKIRIENALSLSDQQLQKILKELNQLAEFETENEIYASTHHPWEGVKVKHASGLLAGEIIQAFEEVEEALTKAQKTIGAFEDQFNWNSQLTISDWKTASKECNSILSLKDKSIDFTLLKQLKSSTVHLLTTELIESLQQYDDACANIKEILIEPEQCIEIADDIAILCKKATDLCLGSLTELQIKDDASQHSNQIKKWEKSENSLRRIASRIFDSQESEVTIGNIKLVLSALGFLSELDKDTLVLRHADSIDQINKPIIDQALQDQKNIEEQKSKLVEVFDLTFDISVRELDESISALANSNVFSILNPKYRAASRTYKTLILNPKKASTKLAVDQLRSLKSYKVNKQKFEQNEKYQKIAGPVFDGIKTNFDRLQDLNEWASRVSNRYSGLGTRKNKIKHVLFNAAISELDAISSEAKGIFVDDLVEELNHQDDQTLSEYTVELKKVLAQKLELRSFLLKNQSNENVTYDLVGKLVANEFASATEQIIFLLENSKVFKRELGQIFTGITVDRNMLRDTVKLSSHLEALELPDSLETLVYSQKLFAFIGKLFPLLQVILNELSDAKAKIKAARSIAQLDIQEYIGTEKIQDAAIAKWEETIKSSLNDKEALNARIRYQGFLENAKTKPYALLLDALDSEGLNFQQASLIFEYLYYRSISDNALINNTDLDIQSPVNLAKVRKKFKALDAKIQKLNRHELAYKLSQSNPPPGNSVGRVSDYTEMGLIRHQALKEKSRAIPIRKLITNAGKALQTLKPCFLMSPLSVAQYIDPHGIKFDMVVIDEASQMRPEDSLGAIGRSNQIVVVGDPKQLPPTTFFNKQAANDEDYEDEDKIDNESILDLALGRFRPTRDLRWHYRSRHESLIRYSNSHFYDDRLIVFPSPENSNKTFGVFYNYVDGIYNASCNIIEAKAIAEAARKFMHENAGKSLGIATMNSSQRDLIDEEMYRIFLNDSLCEAYRRKWDTENGGLEPFFVKNLESVQGDERDAIFVSTVYGPDKSGRVMQRFGPINGKFGHRRLNVLFTRAKHNLVLYTSLRSDDIRATETSSLGLRAFKGFLEYAASGKMDAGTITNHEPASDFEICVKEKLESIGCEAIPQVGVSGYFIDLGVKHPDYPHGFLLGIECDGAMYHSSKSTRDRDRIRQEVLEGLGWEIYRIWSTDWFHNPNKEFEKLEKFIMQSLENRASKIQKREIERVQQFTALDKQVRKFEKQTQKDLFTQRKQSDLKKQSQYRASKKSPVAKPSNDNIVELYDTIQYEDIEDKNVGVRTITIVSSQSDVSTGNINQHSALARAMLGSELNEEVEVDLPYGSKCYRIAEIRKHNVH